MAMVNQPQSVPHPEGPRLEPKKTPDQPLGQPFTMAAMGADVHFAMPEVIQHLPKHAENSPRPSRAYGIPWRWLLLAFLSCVATSAAAVGAFLWLVNLPPSTNCEDPTQITTDRSALSCAQTAADDGDLEAVLAGLALVQGWGAEHWLSHETQPLVEKWSAAAVAAAEQELRQGRREEAEALIGYIPPESSWHATGQDLLAGWNEEWEEGSALMTTAQTAMANQDWRTASAQVLALGELTHPHWREEQVLALSRQIQAEQQAHARIRRAVTLASAGGAEPLMEAMELLLPLTSDLLAYNTAQTYLDRWSDLLLAEGLQRWYNGDLEQAIQITKTVARHPNRAKVAQELMWLSQARQLARQSLGDWKVNPGQMATIYRAMLLANQIPTDSPYHPQAQSSVDTWHTHLEGMGTLQLAQMAGGVHQVNTLKLAIRQAELIPPDHPRRAQAQTLLAHWRQALERLEDAPYLSQAHQWAKTNTPSALRQAIASASRITAHRALRGEAQSWIYVWANRLQILEDRPVLDRAYALAEKGQLSQAVAEASLVRSGRALHDEAQTAMGQWQRAIAAQEQALYAPPQQLPDPLPRAPQPSVKPSIRPTASVAPPASALRPSASPTPSTARARPSAPVVPAPSPDPTPYQEQDGSLPDRIETVPGQDLPLPSRSVDLPPQPLPPPITPSRSPTAPPVITGPPPTATPQPMSPWPIQVLPPAQSSTPAAPDSTSQGSSVPSLSRGATARSQRPTPNTEVLSTGALYAGF
jgi:hypothetical protein